MITVAHAGLWQEGQSELTVVCCFYLLDKDGIMKMTLRLKVSSEALHCMRLHWESNLGCLDLATTSKATQHKETLHIFNISTWHIV